MKTQAALLSALGVLCLVRGLVRPVRALAKTGEVRRCAGRNSFGVCDIAISVDVPVGDSVFSTAAGEVLIVGEDYLHVMAKDEPVILMYQGISPSVRAGQKALPGQVLGVSQGTINFGVTQIGPEEPKFIEPASWLVSRGYSVVQSGTMSDLWCAQGREIHIPSVAREQCSFGIPEAAGFALLPVSIEVN